MKNKVVILESDNEAIELTKTYLAEYDGFEIDSVYSDYDIGITKILNDKPAIVIFSLRNIEIDRVLLNKLNSANIYTIVLSTDFTTNLVIQTLRAGAKNFISKPIIKKDLFICTA